MKIIYAVCSWGLGHATRSLPVIRKLLEENYEVTIISNGRALDLLRKELKEKATFIDIPDYPLLVSENKQQFIAKSMVYWPLFIQRMEVGLQLLTRLLNKQPCDRIISDGRYDMYSKKIPSYFISHQMRIMNPLRIRMFEKGSERFNLFFFKRFKEIIIPDYKTNDLSGDLSHNLNKINEKKLHYVGVLSDFRKKNLKKDIDYFFSLSGPEPQRSILEQKIRSEINNLQGNIVFTLGKTEQKENIKNENIEIFTYLSKDEREEFLNRTKLVISRSGYVPPLIVSNPFSSFSFTPLASSTPERFINESNCKSFSSLRNKHILSTSSGFTIINGSTGLSVLSSIIDEPNFSFS